VDYEAVPFGKLLQVFWRCFMSQLLGCKISKGNKIAQIILLICRQAAGPKVGSNVPIVTASHPWTFESLMFSVYF
jgi:hypothetical protein